MNEHDPTFWTRVAIATLTGAMLAAAMLYLVSGLQIASTELDYADFRDLADREAVAAYRAARAQPPKTPARWIAEMRGPALSPENRQHLEALERRYHLFVYRHGLAEGFITRGAVMLAVLFGLYFVLKRVHPEVAPELVLLLPSD